MAHLIDKIKDIIFKVKDYDRLENDYCTSLCYFTNNRMSKPNYVLKEVETVITDAIGEYMEEGYQQAEKDFMEKSCKYLSAELYTRFNGNECFVASHKNIEIEKFIEDFKNYMKKE